MEGGTTWERVADYREKIAFLEGGRSEDEEVLAGPLAGLKTADEQLDALRLLRVLDERVEAAGHPPVLDAAGRRMIDAGLAAGRIDCAVLATAQGVHRSTVWRRMHRLLAEAPALHRRAATLLGEAEPQPWEHIIAMAKTYAWGGVGDPPNGALDPDDYNRLAAMYGAGADAHRELYPPIGWQVERRGESLIVSGPGPLPPVLADAVLAGQAERIFPGPPRCHACGRYISQAPTGRPAKFCTERCRSRSRRRSR